MTVEQAIEALKKGNVDAIKVLIDLYEVNVYNTCLGLLQNEHDAEEITQDVFVKVCQNSSSFKGESLFTTWLYRIAVNECLQFLRKAKAKKRFHFITSLFGKEEHNDLAVDFVHPGVKLEQKENAAILFQAIKKLPENQQIAFTLKNIEQLSQQEIAAIMHLNEGAVESLLQRAKQNLRKWLTHYK